MLENAFVGLVTGIVVIAGSVALVAVDVAFQLPGWIGTLMVVVWVIGALVVAVKKFDL